MRIRLLVSMLAAAGCWGERAAAPPAPRPSIAAVERPAPVWPSTQRAHIRRLETDRCRIVLGHVFDLARQDTPSSGFTVAMLDELQESTIESCHETQWSESTLDCYADTSTTTATSECYRAMTSEQRDDFEKRFMELRQRGRSSPSPSP